MNRKEGAPPKKKAGLGNFSNAAKQNREREKNSPAAILKRSGVQVLVDAKHVPTIKSWSLTIGS